MAFNTPRGKHAKHSKQDGDSFDAQDAQYQGPIGATGEIRGAHGYAAASASTADEHEHAAPEPEAGDTALSGGSLETAAIDLVYDDNPVVELAHLADEPAGTTSASGEGVVSETVAAAGDDTVALFPPAEEAWANTVALDVAPMGDDTVALPDVPAADGDDTARPLDGSSVDDDPFGVVAPISAGPARANADMAGFDVPPVAGGADDEWQASQMGYVPQFEVTKKKRRKAGKVVAITLGAIAGFAAVVYIAGILAFSNWIMPNTKVGDLDVSLKSTDEAAKMIENVASGYTLDVVGSGFSYRTDAKGVGLKVDSYGVVQAVHDELPSWKWPVLIFESNHDETDCFKTTFNSVSYEKDVKEAVAKYNETATPPTNATIVYDEASDSFKVKEEAVGTQLDEAAVLASMGEAIETLSSKVVLGEDELLQPTLLATDQKVIDAAKFATGMISAKIALNLNGQQVGGIGSDDLAQFVVLNEKGEVTLNEDSLYGWVGELANNYNTLGTERTYTRADGKVISIGGGSYGWDVDIDALKNAIVEAVKAGGSTTIDIPCWSTADTFAGRGARDWGNRYIDIDLAEQYVRFYDWDGSIIWESPCISGKPDGVHDTSTGVFVINAKRSPEKLIGYENGVKIYESNVTYWMPFDGNAIGLHDADWQPGFGGTMYADGYGSHGCVNLPPYAAAELFGIVNEGDVVVCHW